jgi:hypothetical protein
VRYGHGECDSAADQVGPRWQCDGADAGFQLTNGPRASATMRHPSGPRAMRRLGPRRWMVKWTGCPEFGPRGWI